MVRFVGSLTEVAISRPISSASVVYRADPVRVVKRPSGGYRILWTEGKRQRERSATSEKKAAEIAREEAARIASGPTATPSGTTLFAVAVSAATDPMRHDWEPEWAERVTRMVRLHILPQLGQIACHQINADTLQARLNEMSAEDYSYDFVSHVRQMLAMTVDYGIQKHLWEPTRSPMAAVRVPRSRDGLDDGRPDLDRIPTDETVERLRQVAADRSLKYEAMITVAARCGLRWGEILGLTTSAIDLDGAQPNLRVRLNCVEADGAVYRYRPPMKGRGRSKANAAIRTVLIDTDTADVLGRYLNELPDWPVGHKIEGRTPPGRLFAASTGNAISRSNWRSSFHSMLKEVDGWPDDATFHYLRHYCATRWIRIGVEIPTVSRMLGHAQISTTLDWYVDTDADALERAAQILG